MSGDSNFQTRDTPPDGPCPTEGDETPRPDTPGGEPGGPVVDRRFDLGDGLIVIGTLVLSLVSVQGDIRVRFGGVPPERRFDPSFWWRVFSRHPDFATSTASFAVQCVITLLMVWSLAFALVRVRKPRLGLESTAWLPGSVAVWATPAGFVLGLIFEWVGGAPRLGHLIFLAAVPVAWGWLIVTRQWRPVVGWIDRSGRVLGVCWFLAVWLQLGLGVVKSILK